MRFFSSLSHIDGSQVIVLVTARDDDKAIGSTLGQAETVDKAEQIAIEKLNKRFNSESSNSTLQEKPTIINPPNKAHRFNSNDKLPIKLKYQDHIKDVRTLDKDPSPIDWSDELGEIDKEIRRIEWSKVQEEIYLKRAFNKGQRNRLTNYNEITSYLHQLRQFVIRQDPKTATIPITRENLVDKGDLMIAKLSWSSDQARQFLIKNFNRQSRTQLSYTELISFNDQLSEQLSEY